MNPLSSLQNVPYHLSYQRYLDDNSLCTCTFWSIYHSLKFRNDQIDFFQILHRFRRTILYMTASVSWRLNILCIKFKIGAFFLTTLLIQSYVRIDILLTCGKHLHDCIISLRAHKTSLTPPCHFSLVSGPSQESELSCIYHMWEGISTYLCFYNSQTTFWDCSDGVVLLFFFFLHQTINGYFSELPWSYWYSNSHFRICFISKPCAVRKIICK